jgi:hypothetical protein
LKRRREFFKKNFYPIFFIGQNINDGGLRQDELLQILQNLLFFGEFFHKFKKIIQKLLLNVNFNQISPISSWLPQANAEENPEGIG